MFSPPPGQGLNRLSSVPAAWENRGGLLFVCSERQSLRNEGLCAKGLLVGGWGEVGGACWSLCLSIAINSPGSKALMIHGGVKCSCSLKCHIRQF